MSRPTLVATDLGKCYLTFDSGWRRFAHWFGLRGEPAQSYWAVRNANFSLLPGESLALIGPNGAGKSSLLKLVTGTVRPTTGHVSVNGRVSAMLELGLGFNPEFTGRDNVRLAGGMMGLGPRELDSLMPDIISFAELGPFFERPLRVYSSGMQARLAFAVATAVRPDLLIVDEVLSVGDSYFQHKSFDRIREFKKRGSALLFVSHSMADVKAICDRVLLLDKGVVVKDGLPDEVVDYYNALIAAKESEHLSIEQRRQRDGWLLTRSGTGEAVVEQLALFDADSGAVTSTARVGQNLRLVLRVRVKQTLPRLVLGYMLRDRLGHVIWGTNTWHTRQVLKDLSPDEVVSFELRFRCSLGPGSYSFSPALVSSDTHMEANYEWTDNALVFDVVNTDQNFFIGSCQLPATFHISRQEASFRIAQS